MFPKSSGLSRRLPEQLFIKAPSGRRLLNFLGALNAITKKTIALTDETIINTDSIADLLSKFVYPLMIEASMER